MLEPRFAVAHRGDEASQSLFVILKSRCNRDEESQGGGASIYFPPNPDILRPDSPDSVGIIRDSRMTGIIDFPNKSGLQSLPRTRYGVRMKGANMNLTEIRTIVRCDLRDEDVNNYRWSDNEIDRHIIRAVREFSLSLPLEQNASIATTPGSLEIDISIISDYIAIDAVEYPLHQIPGEYRRFSLRGNSITILDDGAVPDGSNCTVYYGKMHTLDENGTTVPVQFEDLIATGAAGYAVLALSVFTVNRVNVGGTDSPGEFLEWGKERLASFKKELKKIRRKNRVRLNTMYC
jgi:hypothetical protein